MHRRNPPHRVNLSVGRVRGISVAQSSLNSCLRRKEPLPPAVG